MMKPCITCGELTEESRCPEHRPCREQTRTDTSTWAWIRLTQRAKAIQPWCLLCGATAIDLDESLQVDHSPRAWARDAQHLPIRLCDVTVLCRRCNNDAGSSKPGSSRHTLWEATDGDLTATTPDPSLPNTQGDRGTQKAPHLRGEAKFGSHMGTTLNRGLAWQD